MTPSITCVILCGGSGTRLWPLSREKMPKQLLALVNEHTMLQNTILRFTNNSSLVKADKFVFVCNAEHSFIIDQQIQALSISIPYEIIAEPVGRDTAPAIAMAALSGKDEDITIVLPSDHVFDDKIFMDVVNMGIPYVKDDKLVLFGVRPTHPATGYGYIHVNDIVRDVHTTIEFVEKPDYETACKYLSSVRHLWNAGVFFFKNEVMLDQYTKYADDILVQCKHTLNVSKKNKNVLLLDKDEFMKCRAISVDYAIMENVCASQTSDSVSCLTIPYKSMWCDVGSFESLHEHLLNTNPSVRNGTNVLIGDVISENTKESYVYTETSMVATIGVSDLVVVNTADALLICNKNNTQDVKRVVSLLKEKNREERIIHKKAHRPWGWYCNIEGNDHSGFKVKRIGVYPGKRLSLQSHDKRSEHWVIVKGKARVQVGHDFLDLHSNQHVYIPKKTLHRMENVGDDMVEFVETQIGEYLGEDDIIRYEDDFGRV